MPKIFHFVLLVFIAGTTQAEKLQRVKEFGPNPGNLKMFIHVPPAGKFKGKLPVVTVLHGCTQTVNVASEQTGWNTLADTYGFYVIYPETKFINNPYLCFNFFRQADINKGKGECESVRQMFLFMAASYPTDTARVFVTGLSAGAAMSVVMMATHPEMIKAGAVFAGVAYKLSSNIFELPAVAAGWISRSPEHLGNFVREQNPAYKGIYPRMIVYQGKADLVVNRRNATQIIKQWTNVLGISGKPANTLDRFNNVKAVTRMEYKNIAGEPLVIYYRVKHLGHAYLIDPGKCRNQGGRRKAFSADKNFFSSYQTALDFGLVPQISVSKTDELITFSVPPYDGSTYRWVYPDALAGAALTSNQITFKPARCPVSIKVIETDSKGCKYDYPEVTALNHE